MRVTVKESELFEKPPRHKRRYIFLKFWDMEVRDTSLQSSLLKNIYLTHDFEPFLEVPGH